MERRVRITFQTLILLAFGMTVNAQPALVTTVPESSTNFTRIGDLVFFTSGGELWRTDGTAGGTILLKSGFPVFNQSPPFTEVNGVLYFLVRGADFTATYKELWRSDGTPAGTILLKTSADNDMRVIGVAGNSLFFQASDPGTGLELFRTNGTPGGTIMLKDINPGPANGFVYYYAAAAVGPTFLFAADNGSSGVELWKTDGTTGGTVMIKDIHPGTGDGVAPNSVFVHNNIFYFKGNTFEHGMEPWISDGSASGTVLLKDVSPGPEGNRFFQYTTAHNDVVYFVSSPPQEESGDEGAITELWKTSGTSASTSKIRNVGDGTVQVDHRFRAYNDKIYFFLQSESGTDNLWVTDGSSTGTMRLFDMQNFEGGLTFFEVVGGYLLFYGDSDGFPTPFYRSNGTSAGTQEFRRFTSGYYLSFPRDVTKVEDFVFFGDHDGPSDMGNPANAEDYYQLMQTDGSTTQSARDLFGDSFKGSGNITDFNGLVLFTTDGDASNMRKTVWVYDPVDLPSQSTTFTLVNADTDQDIKTLVEGEVITKSESENITIRFNPAQVPGSVRFTLNGSNVRTENTAPYSLAGDASGNYAPWTGASPGSYALTATPYSESGGKGTAGTPTTVRFTIEAGTGGEACMASGTILREYWGWVPGNRISDIPVDSNPNSQTQLDIFEGPVNSGTNYGARVRGYICPPATGNYTFWIASNDHSELWLSTDDDPSKKERIAYVVGATNPRQWDKFGTQKSALISLTAGKRYYVEALHKQGVGSDNLAVGWQLPDGTEERPIPGSRLSPFLSEGNQAPNVLLTYPNDGQIFNQPANITIETDASDPDSDPITVEFFEGTNKLGEDPEFPWAFTWSDVAAGTYTLTVKVTDSRGASTTSHPVTITVNEGTGDCTASGTITREYWSSVEGNRVSDIPLDREPSTTNQLTIFEGPSNIGTNYGTRIRGYICPPVSGGYNFYIASNDHSELWLSSDEDPANKRLIAFITGATGPREWNTIDSQSAPTISLEAGKRYYIEALHKQGVGADHIAVGWTWPDGTVERPIPGNRLSPYEMTAAMTSETSPANQALYSQITIYPNPAQSGDLQLSISGYEGIQQTIETQVEIINLTGEVIYSGKVSCGGDCRSYLMNIDKQLVPGVYLVNMKTNGIKMSKRLLVK